LPVGCSGNGSWPTKRPSRVTMIEPQRDLHNAQNPGVLVSDPVAFVFSGMFLIRMLAVVRTPC
jgi:hypothetical protein